MVGSISSLRSNASGDFQYSATSPAIAGSLNSSASQTSNITALIKCSV